MSKSCCFRMKIPQYPKAENIFHSCQTNKLIYFVNDNFEHSSHHKHLLLVALTLPLSLYLKSGMKIYEDEKRKKKLVRLAWVVHLSARSSLTWNIQYHRHRTKNGKYFIKFNAYRIDNLQKIFHRCGKTIDRKNPFI